MAVIYNPETEKFIRDPATIIDSSAGGDTVKQGFEDRTEPALEGIVAAFNFLKNDGMIGAGVPATETARGISRVATLEQAKSGVTGDNGPAFINPETLKKALTASDIAFDNTAGEGEEPVFEATNVQLALNESVINAPTWSFNRHVASSPMTWVANTPLTWAHNLNLTQAQIDRMRFRTDALITAANSAAGIDATMVGRVLTEVLSRYDGDNVYYHPLTPIEISANSLTVRNSMYLSTQGNRFGGGLGVATPSMSKIIFNMWY